MSEKRGKYAPSRLKEERERCGITIKESAGHIGVDRKTWERWEKGTPIPSDKLELIAELGIDVLYVVTGNLAPPLVEEPATAYSVSQLPQTDEGRASLEGQLKVLLAARDAHSSDQELMDLYEMINAYRYLSGDRLAHMVGSVKEMLGIALAEDFLAQKEKEAKKRA